MASGVSSSRSSGDVLLRLDRASQASRYREGKPAPLPFVAVHPYSPAVELDDFLRDRQPQAGAADPLRGGQADLLELFKYPLLVLLRYADSRITDADSHPGLLGGPGSRLPRIYLHADLAPLRGELDRVTEKIGHHLGQAVRIRHHRDRLLGIRLVNSHALTLGPAADRFHDMVHHVLELERQRAQFYLSGFQLGNVQKVVDETREAA